MNRPSFVDRAHHLDVIQAAIRRAADPGPAVRRNLHRSGSQLAIQDRIFDLESTPHLYLLAIGKAAVRMSEAALEILPDQIFKGIVVHRERAYQPPRADLLSFYAGHPLPDQISLDAGKAVASMLGETEPRDLVLCLISGGASAMVEHAPPGIELAELIELTQRLLKSGAPIEDINTVRKALSLIKGGGLLSLAAPATVAGLILSDVVGDHLPDIGSGPSVPQSVSRAEARTVLERLGLWEAAAPAIKRSLASEPVLVGGYPDPVNVIIATNRDLLLAASEAAGGLGFSVEVNEEPLQGEARAVGEQIAARACAHATKAPGTSARIYGGETIVTVIGDGLGGRNQELALAAALVLDGQSGITLMAFASDGVDGPTDAAGAIIDGKTCARMRACGIDPRSMLSRNDSYHALEAAGALIRSGPSRTNLNDVVVLLDYGSGQV